MSPILISVFAFIAVAALCGAVIVIVKEYSPNVSERRLRVLAGQDGAAADTPDLLKRAAFGENLGLASKYLAGIAQRFCNPRLLFQQADSPISFETFLGISAGLGALGTVAAALGRAPLPLYPVMALTCCSLPMLWILMRRRARFKKFSNQLPGTLQLLSRALRSGHGLASGIQFVVKEMRPPMSTEFAIVWEAQNMGLPMDQALNDLVRRVPDPDLRFAVALVIVQRETGGDLAEMLDKISYTVLERFKIMGQVRALTGEGRMSGAVLLALPILLFFTVFYLNRDYVMILFENDLGKKMLLVAGILQLVGAFTIKKIVDIKI